MSKRAREPADDRAKRVAIDVTGFTPVTPPLISLHQRRRRVTAMRGFGLLLLLLGIGLVLVAFGMNTSVSSFGMGEVKNLGLLQQQMMVLQTGLGMFVGGSVLFAGSAFQGNSAGRLDGLNHRRLDDVETEEDREERLAGVRRLNQIIGFVILGIIGLLILVAVIATR